MPLVAASLSGFAAISVDQRNATTAVRLLAVAAGLLESASGTASHIQLLDAVAGQAREMAISQMGQSNFEAVWAIGRDLALDDAVAEAQAVAAA
jgi:hypothetical protein